MNHILEQLNEAQRKAVVNYEGPSMVIAGAGSGKTRVLTYRVAYLLQQGIDPFTILALTFTNKAAREMKERILKLVGTTDAKSVWMGTFHSIFARILRVEGTLLGYPPNYTIYDTDDSKSLIRTITKEQGLDPKVYPPGYVLGRISAAKTNLISPAEYNNNTELTQQDKLSAKPMLGTLYSIYNERCKKAMAMDFDDLLFNMNLLLRDFPEVLLKYQKKFRFILVDEYQDTNYAQYLIVKKLAARHENICVVGDDAQSIYGFRGANIRNILNFKNDYPDYKIYKLEQNYRSTKNIVRAANSIIRKNKEQIYKEVWTDNEEGGRLKLMRATTDTEEGQLVANSIFEIKMNYQLPNSHFAILYRTNSQSRSMEEALRKLNIPYRIYGGLSFYKRKEIKDMLAYFRLVINTSDEEALKRIINYPARGIGQTTMERVMAAAGKMKLPLWHLLENIDKYEVNINQGIRTRITNFVNMINAFVAERKKRNAYDLASDIAKASGIMKDLYEDKTPEGISKFDNIEELLNGIKDFTVNEPEIPAEEQNEIRTLDMYLQDISLLTDADTDDKNNTDKVSLMTIHAAKGLEFPYVYIVGLEENLFPSIQSLNSRSDLEEERRLFYVALTRAQKLATLSYAESRYRWGNLSITEPSRFIEEIDEKYIDIPGNVMHMGGRNHYGPPVNSGNTFGNPAGMRKIEKTENLSDEDKPVHETASDDDIKPGVRVYHQKFGNGKVLSVEGKGANKKATVFFPAVGQKTLLLKYAKLAIVG